MKKRKQYYLDIWERIARHYLKYISYKLLGSEQICFYDSVIVIQLLPLWWSVKVIYTDKLWVSVWTFISQLFGANK